MLHWRNRPPLLRTPGDNPERKLLRTPGDNPERKLLRTPGDNPEGKLGLRGPVTLEIGFGNGEFLVRSAQADPERTFVGIEMEWNATRRALRRIAQLGLSNVLLLQGDARLAVQCAFAPGTLDQVTILFPCPWPKPRHARHRLFSVQFLRLLSERLTHDGHVWIVTDFHPLFEEIQANAREAGMPLETRTVSPGLDTKYERRWRSEGQQEFYESRLGKGSQPAMPFLKEIELKTYLVKQFPLCWEPEAHTEGELRVTFRETLLDRAQQKAMTRAFVVEDGWTQEFWIELSPDGDQWMLKPAHASPFFPTRGAQLALDRARASLPGE